MCREKILQYSSFQCRFKTEHYDEIQSVIYQTKMRSRNLFQFLCLETVHNLISQLVKFTHSCILKLGMSQTKIIAKLSCGQNDVNVGIA